MYYSFALFVKNPFSRLFRRIKLNMPYIHMYASMLETIRTKMGITNRFNIVQCLLQLLLCFSNRTTYLQFFSSALYDITLPCLFQPIRLCWNLAF